MLIKGKLEALFQTFKFHSRHISRVFPNHIIDSLTKKKCETIGRGLSTRQCFHQIKSGYSRSQRQE